MARNTLERRLAFAEFGERTSRGVLDIIERYISRKQANERQSLEDARKEALWRARMAQAKSRTRTAKKSDLFNRKAKEEYLNKVLPFNAWQAKQSWSGDPALGGKEYPGFNALVENLGEGSEETAKRILYAKDYVKPTLATVGDYASEMQDYGYKIPGRAAQFLTDIGDVFSGKIGEDIAGSERLALTVRKQIGDVYSDILTSLPLEQRARIAPFMGRFDREVANERLAEQTVLRYGKEQEAGEKKITDFIKSKGFTSRATGGGSSVGYYTLEQPRGEIGTLEDLFDRSVKGKRGRSLPSTQYKTSDIVNVLSRVRKENIDINKLTPEYQGALRFWYDRNPNDRKRLWTNFRGELPKGFGRNKHYDELVKDKGRASVRGFRLRPDVESQYLKELNEQKKLKNRERDVNIQKNNLLKSNNF